MTPAEGDVLAVFLLVVNLVIVWRVLKNWKRRRLAPRNHLPNFYDEDPAEAEAAAELELQERERMEEEDEAAERDRLDAMEAEHEREYFRDQGPYEEGQ